MTLMDIPLPTKGDVPTLDSKGLQQKKIKRRHKRELRKTSFGYRIVDPWNSLPESVISAPSTKCFERRLDKFWQNQDIKFDFNSHLKIIHKNNAPNPCAKLNKLNARENMDLVESSHDRN